MKTTPVQILVIEDNPADAEMIRRCFGRCNLPTQLTIVEHGEDALDILQVNAKYSDSLCPDLILLDLSLPRMSGMQVLREVKSDDVLRKIPIVMLTASDKEEHVHEAHELKVSRYFIKPIDQEGFDYIIHSIQELWLEFSEQENLAT